MTPVPAVAGIVPEEDGPEGVGRVNHAVVLPPVAVVPGSVDDVDNNDDH